MKAVPAQMITTTTVDLGGEEFDDETRFPNFRRHYFGELGRPVANADEVLRCHFALAKERMTGQCLLHVLGRESSIGHAVQIVTDDMPGIVDSVLLAISRVHAVADVVLHPVVNVERDADGVLASVRGASETSDAATSESWIHVSLRGDISPEAGRELYVCIETAIAQMRLVSESVGPLCAVRVDVEAELGGEDSPHGEHVRDAVDFLRWCGRGNFTVIGYQLRDGLELRRSLGLLEGHSWIGASAATLPGTTVLRVTSMPFLSGIDKSEYTAVVTVDWGGREHAFIGSFTSAGRNAHVFDIPAIGRRVREVLTRSGHSVDSFAGRAMTEMVQALPLTELFTADPDLLYRSLTEVSGVDGRNTVHVYVRPLPSGTSVSALVFVPRERYSTSIRTAIEGVLKSELRASALEFSSRISEFPLAVVHFTMSVDSLGGAGVPSAVADRIRERVVEACRTWEDALSASDPEHLRCDSSALAHYCAALPAGYKHDWNVDRALRDIPVLERLSLDGVELAFSGRTGLTLYVGGRSVSLGEVLPILQSFGVDVLDERPYRVVNTQEIDCRIYEFGIRYPALPEAICPEDAEFSHRFSEAFRAMWTGSAEVDALNELISRTGSTWREVVMLRAYVEFLQQAGFSYSAGHIATVLCGHPEISVLLTELFAVRFDPEGGGGGAEIVTAAVESAIAGVSGMDADRILRAMFGLIRSTLRTNFYVRGDRFGSVGEGCVSFKFDSESIDELPSPRPKFEIFVYGAQVAGVHMRWGAVARGGLRWSDRREDFRTEVLGLVKAQAVKNAVIVPAGAKGGFVVKNPPTPTGVGDLDREALSAEGIRCYRSFISAMLDVTDNVDSRSGDVVPAARVVRWDGDDTYLVVAADKGTAKFSDFANAVAAKYNFWLGDAFASGGSVGYDHKALGITAKGAWSSVTRHFRELGIDSTRDDFTAVGIGDMSGDVFGNGMLASAHIRLIAAFDHRHIFLDPNPVAASSFAERQRLFRLARSSWVDYDPSTISAGGGVYARSVKSVPIGEPVRRALGLSEAVTELSPPELVHAILRAPVDLMWNGGIGTYVKAASETDLSVGDKGNDAVRIDAATVRARVVGEGGNLGFTQAGRIEFARAGGKINTDAVDNSAGVDCSDHEVNIKILLDGLVGANVLAAADRDPLLASMAAEVSALVLADNESQNEVLGIARSESAALLGVNGRLISRLEKSGALDRALEGLPSKASMGALAKSESGLSSPELAVVMAYVKLDLKRKLLAGSLLDDAAFVPTLIGYFPQPLQQSYAESIGRHPLRRDIIATVLTNEVVDHGGLSYVFRIADEVGADEEDAVRAFVLACAVFDLPRLWRDIRTADVGPAVSDQLTLVTRRLLDRASRWMLTRRPQPLDLGAEMARFRDRVAAVADVVPHWLVGSEAERLRDRVGDSMERGAPEALAHRVQSLLDQFGLLDVVEIAEISGRSVPEVGELYFRLVEHVGLGRLLSGVSGLARDNRWNTLARLSLRDELYAAVRTLCLNVLSDGLPEDSTELMIAEWEVHNSSKVVRARAAFAEFDASGHRDLAALSVATGLLRRMVA